MRQAARFGETLRRLAIFDEGFVTAGFGPAWARGTLALGMALSRIVLRVDGQAQRPLEGLALDGRGGRLEVGPLAVMPPPNLPIVIAALVPASLAPPGPALVTQARP
jgi:hypothetical protein